MNENIKVGMEVKDFGGSLHAPVRTGIVTSIENNQAGIQSGASFWVRDVKWLMERK